LEARQLGNSVAASRRSSEVQQLSNSAKAKAEDKTLPSFCAKSQNLWMLTGQGRFAAKFGSLAAQQLGKGKGKRQSIAVILREAAAGNPRLLKNVLYFLSFLKTNPGCFVRTLSFPALPFFSFIFLYNFECKKFAKSYNFLR
jgi:hypothetical protein